MIIRHVIEMVVNPFFICLLLFFIFLVLLCTQNDNHLIRNGFISIFALLLIISTGWLPKILSHHLEGQYPVINQINPDIHWVVVFGGGQHEVINTPSNSILNSVSIDRLVEGVRLYRQLPQAKLLLSGGGINAEVSEATHLSEVAVWFKIPKKNIVLEITSENTAAEARAIKPLVRTDPFYLVTSAIHMPRAMALCQAQGLHPIAAPTDFTSFWEEGSWERNFLPSAYNLFYLNIAMHEILGSIAAKFAFFRN